MKKLMSLMLGLAFLGGTVALADDVPSKDTSKSKAKSTKGKKASTARKTTEEKK